MATIRFDAPVYSDVVYVDGVFNRDERIERALYNHCKRYFDENYRSVFFVGNDLKDEIFQETFITLWEKIASKKIYVEDGVLKGKEGKPFTGKLTTYFMSVAKIKYLEYVRKNKPFEPTDDDSDWSVLPDLFYDNKDEVMCEIVAECISHMSKRCNEILTLFYYEEKNLDDIMKRIPEFVSKDALKTRKYKCMEELRISANSLYQKYINA